MKNTSVAVAVLLGSVQSQNMFADWGKQLEGTLNDASKIATDKASEVL